MSRLRGALLFFLILSLAVLARVEWTTSPHVNIRFSKSANAGSGHPDPLVSKFTAALKSVSTTPVNILVIGDSMSTIYQDSFAGVGPSGAAHRWPDLFAAYVQSKYGFHGTGLIPIDHANLNTAFWSSKGGYSTSPKIGPHQGSPTPASQMVVLKSGQSIKSTALSADFVYVYCGSGPDSAPVEVAIDGTAKPGACGHASTYTIQRVAYQLALPATKHSVTLSGPPMASGYLLGTEWSVNRSGVAVSSVARSAIRTEWLDTEAKMMPYSALPNVSLVIIALGTNDYLQVPGPGTKNSSNANAFDPITVTEANLITIVQGAKANFPKASILLLGEPPTGAWGMAVGAPNKGGFSQAQYILAAHNAASAEKVAWGSWFDRYHQDPKYAVNAGFIMPSDKTHPTDLGAADMALMVEQQVLGSID